MASGGVGRVGREASHSALGFLELSRAIEDAQYGFRGVVNNIPQIVMLFGGGAGLAGAISIASVALNQLANVAVPALGKELGLNLQEPMRTGIALIDQMTDAINRQAAADENAKKKKREYINAVEEFKEAGGKQEMAEGKIFKEAFESMGPGADTLSKLVKARIKDMRDRGIEPKPIQKIPGINEAADLAASAGPFGVGLAARLAFGGMPGKGGAKETEADRKAALKAEYERTEQEISRLRDLAISGKSGSKEAREDLLRMFKGTELEKAVADAIQEASEKAAAMGTSGKSAHEAMARAAERHRDEAEGDRSMKEFLRKEAHEKQLRANERMRDEQEEERSFDKFYNKEEQLRTRIEEMKARQGEKKDLGTSFGLAEFRQKMQKDIMGDDTAKRHLNIAEAQLAVLRNIATKEQEALVNRFGNAMGPE